MRVLYVVQWCNHAVVRSVQTALTVHSSSSSSSAHNRPGAVTHHYYYYYYYCSVTILKPVD
jgi:hypothetical protein